MMKKHSESLNTKSFQNEADYEAALAEIALVFDALPDTPEDERLKILVTLVEAYEDIHYPMGASDLSTDDATIEQTQKPSQL